MKTREQLLKWLENDLQDDAGKLETDDIGRSLDRAVLLYSIDRPRERIKEETGDGVTYLYSLPTDWVEGFSQIVGRIEYPADESQTIMYIDQACWMYFKKIVADSMVTYLRFTTFKPQLSKKLRYAYIVPHTCTNATSTIFDIDNQAVVTLAASLCFWSLAAKFAQSTDSSIGADVVDYQRISDAYIELAKARKSEYKQLMGIGSEATERSGVQAGTSTSNFDIQMSFGDEMLTHPMGTH